jgi:hypothetical protein
MRPDDLARIPEKPDWLAFLAGRRPDYPEKAMQSAFASIRQNLQEVREDTTTADTRLADYLLDLQPVTTEALMNLTTGGYFAKGRIWVLHSRFRYFDPEKRRAGLPDDVAALVETLEDRSATLTLVNTNQAAPRTVVVQGGAYAEHRVLEVDLNGTKLPVGGKAFTVRLAPGSGARLRVAMDRYKNPPSWAMPWD